MRKQQKKAAEFEVVGTIARERSPAEVATWAARLGRRRPGVRFGYAPDCGVVVAYAGPERTSRQLDEAL